MAINQYSISLFSQLFYLPISAIALRVSMWYWHLYSVQDSTQLSDPASASLPNIVGGKTNYQIQYVFRHMLTVWVLLMQDVTHSQDFRVWRKTSMMWDFITCPPPLATKRVTWLSGSLVLHFLLLVLLVLLRSFSALIGCTFCGISTAPLASRAERKRNLATQPSWTDDLEPERADDVIGCGRLAADRGELAL